MNVFTALLRAFQSQPAPAPVDPAVLHDELYRRASVTLQPYLILQGPPPEPLRDEKTRARVEDALRTLDRVVEINGQNWAALWMAGKGAQALGDHERAYGYFTRSFAIERENPDVARELMITCLETRRAAEAVTVGEHAVQLAPDDAGHLANLALAKCCAGDPAGAETAIEGALKKAPRDKTHQLLKKLIGKIRRGERPAPQTPDDLNQ